MYLLPQNGEKKQRRRMKHYGKIVISCLASILITTLVSPSVSYAHYDTAYWNTGTVAQNKPDWMKHLNDNLTLSQLSLPGTHDTMAHKADLTGLDITRTQTMDLWSQLVSGIRVLDIRLHYEDSGKAFTIYHGAVHVGYNLDDVLTTVQKFLREHPSETVLMRLKQEESSADDEQMQTLFDIYYNKYKDMFYRNNSQNPTLKDMRGKCVILSDVLSLNSYGISCRDINTQDDYYLGSNWDLYAKWEKIKNQINQSDQSNNSVLYMNYSSGSGWVFPYFVASGHSDPGTGSDRLSTILTEPAFHDYYPDFPRGSSFGGMATIYFEGANTLTADYLVNNRIGYCGMVMADFPGQRLIDAIINCNPFAVTLYEDGDYGGNNISLSEGTTTYSEWNPVRNDTVSSVKVANGYRVTLYEHGDRTGKSLVLTSDTNWVGNNFNDMFSAAVVEKIDQSEYPVILYKEAYFGGEWIGLFEGKSDANDWGHGWNDAVSSIKIAPGYSVTIYEHGNFQGTALAMGGSSGWLGEFGMNDMISSIVIKKTN